MQAHERELIAGLFERLRPFDSQPRDPEAERLIANFVERQPSSAYLLAQTVLVQEQALRAAQARIAELEGKRPGGGAAGPLMPPGGLSSADLAQDDGAADDYDMTGDNSGFDDSNNR